MDEPGMFCSESHIGNEQWSLPILRGCCYEARDQAIPKVGPPGHLNHPIAVKSDGRDQRSFPPLCFYNAGSTTAPTKCPPGTANALTGSGDKQDCQMCPAGSISVDSGSACRPCPAGYSCDPTSSLLIHCSPGQYSLEGELHCSQCPNGFVCPDARDWELCPPGKEPAQDQSHCIPCPPGYFSSRESPKCLPCLPGNFCPFTGKMQQLVLSNGSLKDAQGPFNSCTCNNSTRGEEMAELHRSNAVTIICTPGHYSLMSQHHDCQLCPAGHYCADGITVTPCPAGSFSDKAGLQHQNQCSLCPAGYYCVEGMTQAPGVESLCPEGFYCPLGTRSSHAYPCPAGTYNDRLGQGHRGSCKVCSEGLFCQEGSFVSGSPCSRGKFCPGGTSREQDCPPGTFTQHLGASRIEQCVLCPVGFYCLSNTSHPIPCPSGTFNPLEGQDDGADCILCPAGSACTRAGLHQPDTDCSAGYVCPAGTRSPTSSENACPAGTFSNSHNLSHKAQCDLCPARFFCVTGSGGRQRPPVSCPRGHYCPVGTKLGTQYKCPSGMWSDRSGLASDTECYPCPSGWFCFAGADSPSGKCSAGHFCPEGSQFGSQFPCPPGTFNLKLGSVRVGECKACPVGSYCPLGSSKPAMCPRGTYRAEQGAQNVGECELCPAGTSCSKIGMGSPVPCGVGNFSDQGAVFCLVCPAGHYCNEDRTSRERMMQLVCPAGTLCPRGMSCSPEEDIYICPQGYYCPEGTMEPTSCPNGTYGDQPGLGKLEECLVCPEGYYCYQEGLRPAGITKPTDECPKGYYCPRGTGFPLANPCQPGTYWNSSIPASGVSPCYLCPAGYFCEVPSLLTPKLCPAGFHCMPGSMQPQPCPDGTYSSKAGLSSQAGCKTCDAGLFCAGEGLTEPSGYCREGYYCPGGATRESPPGGLCPVGSYCPAGANQPTLCPPGSYSNQTGIVNIHQCLICPPGMFCDGHDGRAPSGSCRAGYYCTSGSTSPIQHEVMEGFFSLDGAFRPEPCPPGTFQPGTFTNTSGNTDIPSCTPCPSGMYCGKPGLSEPEGLCQEGYYCKRGSNTSNPVDLPFGDICPAGYFCSKGIKRPCPPGTWNDRREAEDRSWCFQCPPGSFCDAPALLAPSGQCHAGYFCIASSVSPRPDDGITGNVCPKKHFCPEGSSEPNPCRNGTFSNRTGQAVCNLCPSGHLCLDGDIVLCPPGFYCTEEPRGNLVPCPPGTFNPTPGLTRADGCHPCPPGMFCQDWGSSEPSGLCHAGFFCTAGSLVPNPTGQVNESFGGPCPVGYFCPPGSGAPVLCAAGTFSDRFMLTTEAQCILCPPGHYCDSAGLSSPTGLCLPGFYCGLGVSSSAPTGENGGECPVGHYCPGGSSHPITCPAGTYNNLTRQDVCLSCPAGFYCRENTSNYNVFPCPPGFYCPKGTRYAGQFPCPRGYFNPDPSTQSLDSCLPCTPGHYCGREGLSAASGKCDPGWFCVSAAWTPQPFDLDNYTSANCLCPATATGGKCLPGFYCPEGTTEPIVCPPGMYCEGAAEGSHHPQPCPRGTFSSDTGLGSESACKPCPPGYYCQGTGQTTPTGLCFEGFFCPGRQSLPNNLPCPRGHFCLAGSWEPSLCEAGWYQNEEKQTTCHICEAGYYCDSRREPVSDFRQFLCPQGYFCPRGTQYGTQHPCPTGTYGASSGLTTIEGCVKCPPGKYCQGEGLENPTGDCASGYWCKDGAKEDHPRDEVSGVICPHGHYCTAGTHLPSPCPPGTWSGSEGMSNGSECQPCPGGHFCNNSGQVSPGGLCAPGYYCDEGSHTPMPRGGLCPPGHFCLSGSASPTPCPPGTYMTQSGAVECYTCPSGFYCPRGTGLDWKPCPPGTYNPELGLESLTSCRACDGGKFCSFQNATGVTGDCWEGYYCTAESQLPNPELHRPGSAGPCPPGHFCPHGSLVPMPCPVGTFSPKTKLQNESGCSLCPPGHYCSSPGIENPTGQCSEGFYCKSSAVSPHPPSADQSGGPCPMGHFCPAGSAAPQQCPPGTYNPIERQIVCQPCLEGFFCPRSTTSLEEKECPPGFYCPQGTFSPEQYPCPRGTYNPHEGLHRIEDCLPCDPGHYCTDPGQKEVTGRCSAGFYCTSSVTTPTPNQGILGDLCPRGHYCLNGSSSPSACPLGSYSNTTGNVGPEACIPCESGHYCPNGTKYAKQYPCPWGTFSEVQGAVSIDACQLCPPGMFCSMPGLERPDGDCAPGWFCPAGSISEKPSTTDQATGMCPKGTFCPQGSTFPIPCTPGYFCGYPALDTVSGICDAGYYCSGASYIPNPQDKTTGDVCPPGHFCIAGSSSPSSCPPGTFLPHPGAQSLEECIPCTAGWYCSQRGNAFPDTLCLEGWYCPVGTSHLQNPDHLCPVGYYCPTGSAEPKICPRGQYQDQVGQSQCKFCPAGKFCGPVTLATETGERIPEDMFNPTECPTGHYCVQGTEYGYQHPCPRGTFSNKTGLISMEGCTACPGGQFCATPGLSSPSGLCSPGYYCSLNALVPNPTGDVTGALCPAGYYCPAGSSSPSPCPRGTFQPQPGMSSHSACLACPGGKFCRGEGITDTSGNCSAGFYCVSGSHVDSPINGITGSSCPKGHRCPVGVAAPIPCEKGFFQDLEGAASCKVCPAGFYCDPTESGGVFAPRECLVGHFCPEGSHSGGKHKCPRGTYSPKTKLTTEGECLLCPTGFFCASEGLEEPTGRCLTGYWCFEGATISNPTDGVTGGVCPKGKYCASGDITGDCQAGYYCDSQSSRPDPVLCPPGFYCPQSTESPQPCDPGSYAPFSGNRGSNDCQPCPPGHFCNSTGQTSWQGLCSAGFFCPPGQISSRPAAYRCPSGFFCPEGSATPTPCESGTYQSQDGKETCKECPAGFYCSPTNASSGVTMPMICPTGHYCPPGASFITVYPCPEGTYGPKTGASSISDCEVCPSGMYCSSEGLLKPTGYCHAGYYCSLGAVNPTPINPRAPSNLHSLAQNDICPAGHYCPHGTLSPVPCPVGTYSMASGLSSYEECQPCPAGHYCAQTGLSDLSHALPCSAGTCKYMCLAYQMSFVCTLICRYVCKDGSSVSCPSDEIHGYQCPAGFYCPRGSTLELPCPPGTFSPLPGAAVCLPCPAGTSCMDVSTVDPISCPRGNYCPAMTAAPMPCPEGTFNPLQGALSSAACKTCPAGRYCRGEANWEPDGLCSAGYYCEGEAADSVPQKTARFLLNGPCPLGHYCPEGTQSPKPCPAGTLKNATGGVSLESCEPCFAGHFCASAGLSSPSGVCVAGFYCPANFTSISPTSFLCPKGHFCPAGASYPAPCPTGQYQPNHGAHYCIPCQPGFYCQEAIAGDPHKCPPHSYCSAGALFPSPCPNGTFTPEDMSGLREKGECLLCPSGKYCRGGKLQGSCAAGHFCLAGSSEHTPSGQNFSRSTLNECKWGQMCAGICPAGFYCEEGTALPIPCPVNTLRASPGARHKEDCLPCPLGQWCREGHPAPVPCPAGHYCSGINQTNPSQAVGPQECPIHTYRNHPGAERLGDCTPCPPGYLCRMPGIVTFQDYPCPPGYWCPGLGDSVPCPAGTHRSEQGAASVQDCESCPIGHYCPDPTLTLEANIMGIPCRQGYECPLGSITETVCRAGSYCKSRTGNPLLCPGGYYCPEGSSTHNTSRQLCRFPHYCPPGSQQMMTCPGGSTAVQVSGLRDSAELACRRCEAGTYRSSGTSAAACQPCPAGFSCLLGTENYQDHPCQAGYYCPSSATAPVPCPPGMYGSSTQARGPEDCHPCPSGTYNHLPAQVACFSCGSSSHSVPGSRSCTCQGLNRAFQESDGSCICQTGFVFYDNREQKRSDGNSDQDCQPQVEQRCAAGEVRLASTRKCVSLEQHDCTPICGLLGGELNPELGMCHCTQYVSAEELCDRLCLGKAPRIYMSFGPNKQFMLQIEEREFRRSRNLEVVNVLGPDDHVLSSEQVHLVLFSSSGIFGVILSTSQAIETFFTGDSWSVPTPRKSRSIEQVVSSPDHGSLPRIPNPILCLTQGDIVLFQLSINPNERNTSHYPVYLKDHLYNSNPDWDFGAFRRLDHLIRETQMNISRFAHVFGDPGTFVFTDNAIKDRSLFVTVKDHNVECDPTASHIQPSSPYQLIKNRIADRHKLNLEPNWMAILGVLLLLFLLMILLLVSTVVLRPSLYSPNPMKAWKPRWRSLGEPYIPPEYILTKDSIQFYETLGCHGSGEILDIGKNEITYGSDQRATVRNLEDFNVRTLFDKLEDQNLHMTSQMGRHRNDTLSFYKAFIQRIQVVKGVEFDNSNGLEWRRIPPDGDVGSCCTGVASQQSEESVTGTYRDCQALCRQGPFWQEASSLMKVLKFLLMNICSEQRKDQAEQNQKHGRGMGFNEQNSSNLIVSLQNAMSKNWFSNLGNGLSLERLNLQPLLFITTLYRDTNLKMLLTASPLTRTLEEIKEALRRRAEQEMKITVSLVTSGPLVPLDMSKLSAHQLIVYRFGCAILRLLCPSCVQKPLQLLIADTIPRTSAWKEREDLLVGESYYDMENKVLFIPGTCLEHAGYMIAVIVHALAHIKAGLNQVPGHPDFLKAINKAIEAIGVAFFHLWDQQTIQSRASEGNEEDGERGSSSDIPVRTAFGDLLFIHKLPRYNTRRLVFYKGLGLQNTVGGILEPFSQRKQSVCSLDNSTQQVCCLDLVNSHKQEEALDLLNEEFLKLTIQALKNKAGSQKLSHEITNWEDPSEERSMLVESKCSLDQTLLLLALSPSLQCVSTERKDKQDITMVIRRSSAASSSLDRPKPGPDHRASAFDITQ
ncbi:uncharacterized protein RCH25_007839 [Pelodytes ibericus]